MAQIIIINSINNAAGKTLLTAHLAVMLASEYKTAVLDNAGENSALAMFIARRYNLNLSQKCNLPIPPYYSLQKEKFDTLKNTNDVLLLDSPDEKYFKHADILITPLYKEEGALSVSSPNSLYASLIWEAKKKRAAIGKNAFRWVVVPNDDYTDEQIEKISASAKTLGFQISSRLHRRNEYAAGLKNGITVLDKDLPELKTLFDLPDLYARRELKKLASFIWPAK